MKKKIIRLESVEEHFKKWYSRQTLGSKIQYHFWRIIFHIQIEFLLFFQKLVNFRCIIDGHVFIQEECFRCKKRKEE